MDITLKDLKEILADLNRNEAIYVACNDGGKIIDIDAIASMHMNDVRVKRIIMEIVDFLERNTVLGISPKSKEAAVG